MTTDFDGGEYAADAIHDEIDIEAFARERPHDHKPKAHRYVYRVNKQRLTTTDPLPTREEILTAAGLIPVEDYRLRLKRGKGDPLEVQAGEKVDLTEPGVERFIANKLHVQDGLSERRDVQLPEEDETFLTGLGLRWEVISCGRMWVIVRDWQTPDSFNPDSVDIAFEVTSYPAGVIDMAYFRPSVTRASGQAIPQADVTVSIDGADWQRWSRHRVEGVNAWNPARDSLASHYAYMLDWFKRELER